jgi:glucose/arabinose dehydrogenase
MNNRDQIDTLWPAKFKTEDNQTRPSEPMYKLEQDGHYGWPFCYFDLKASAVILNPEYGGDGKTVGRCATFKTPIAAFEPHWAPVDVSFYTGTQFPAKYRGGAFIAFHGSWNRAPEQHGYNVSFQPFAGGKPSGKSEIFADGFAGVPNPRTPAVATYRADGVMQGPDGSLYIAESEKGRLWRVVYRGATR